MCVTIVASEDLERALHFNVKVSPAREAQRAGPGGRTDDIAGSGILPFTAMYIMKDMTCLVKADRSGANRENDLESRGGGIDG